MKTYPAVRDPGSIELLFRNIRSKEEPDKMTTDYLASVGFRRQSDVKLLELLYFLGFIDNNLAPTEQWKAIRNVNDKHFGTILSRALSRAYADVFAHQTEIQSADSKALMSFFKSETGVSETESAYMVLTLQVLNDLVGPEGEKSDPQVIQSSKPPVSIPEDSHIKEPETPIHKKTPLPETITLNITIPAEAFDAELTELIKKLLLKTM